MAVDELPDHTDHLASQILNDGETVSYRNLSRALKVHVNTAKRMLFDFHQRQNRKRPKSVHAVYLLQGRDSVHVSTADGIREDEDTIMQSSPPFSSSALHQPVEDEPAEQESVVRIRITLAKEADLEQVKLRFSELQSIHIYSLSAAAPQDLQTLTDCSRRVAVASINEDPLKDWAQYGVIQNDHVKRRPTKRPPPAAALIPEPKPALASSKPALNSKPANPDKKEPIRRSDSDEQSRPASRASNTSKPTSKPPTMKRDSSSLMKAFANAPPKKPKPAAAGQQPLDETPALSDEEADGDEGMDLDVGAITAAGNPSEKEEDHKARKSKKDRESELQAMMDAEDEDMPDIEPEKTAPAGSTDESQEQSQDAVEPDPQTLPEADAGATDGADEVETKDGRRRGRRRVMKKRTVKDEEGYLVTKEEAAWESFSEDEPVAKKAVAVKSAGLAKKTAAGKKGQGSIMSFFGKK